MHGISAPSSACVTAPVSTFPLARSLHSTHPPAPHASIRSLKCEALTPREDGLVIAGPSDAAPSYAAIDATPLNRVVYTLFRNKMVASLDGQDSDQQGYAAIIDLTRRLNTLGTASQTQNRT